MPLQIHALTFIKLLHTAIWAVLAGCVFALLWAGWTRRFRPALWLSLIILGECLVIAFNGGRCPLTDLAARYSSEQPANFDIYLPLWLARYNKQIFGTLYLVGELITVWQWRSAKRRC